MAHPASTSFRAPYRRTRDPFNDLAALRTEMARLLSAFSSIREDGGWFGDVNIDDDDDGWTVTARLPGVAPEEVLVEVEDRELRIRSRHGADGSDGAQQQAGGQTSFDYRLALPGDVDPDQVDATMDHGLLTVRLPRSGRGRRRQITIGRGPRRSVIDPDPTAAGTAGEQTAGTSASTAGPAANSAGREQPGTSA